MKYRGANRYHSIYVDLAQELGELRNMLNAQMMKEKVSFQRGERAVMVSYMGILGELIVRDTLRLRRIGFRAAKLIDKNPIPEPDFEFLGATYDVKTIREDGADFLVNEDAHKKRKAEHYLFVRLEDNHFATIWEENWSIVSQWPLKNVRYSNAYYRPIIQSMAFAVKDEWQLQPIDQIKSRQLKLI